MTRALLVRAILVALMVLSISALLIDWNAMIAPLGRQDTIDATLVGNLVRLSARATGDLIDVPAQDYATVHRGDLLFAIDDAEYRARRDGAAAALAAAEAGIVQAQAQTALQEAQALAAAADLRGAQAGLERARLERVRQAKLLHTESFLQRDWQDARSAEARQAAAASQSGRALDAAKTQVRVLRAEEAGRMAARDAARAALALADVELGYTRIRAPADGILTVRLARPGAYVVPGTALITLVPQDDVWVVANYREVQLDRVRPGQRARVTIDALPGIMIGGHVDSLEPASQANGFRLPPDRATGSFTRILQRVPVKIVLDRRADLAGLLRPGLSAEVSIYTGEGS